MYIAKLNDIVNKNNTYDSTIKMKPVDVKSNTYIDFSVVKNETKVLKLFLKWLGGGQFNSPCGFPKM